MLFSKRLSLAVEGSDYPGTMPRRPSTPRSRLVAIVALTLVWVLAGCSAGGRSPTARDEGSPGPAGSAPVTGAITVSAAASLTVPFTAIAEDFRAANPGAEVTFTFDSSGTLARQIVDGAPVDVFAAADEASMATVADAGLIVGSPEPFARNRLAIVVKAGNPTGVESLADLATVAATGTVALCGSEVPCGRYADQLLADAGVVLAEGSVTRGQNVKATLAAVADGDADAGIVYVSDISGISGDKVQAVAIPDERNIIARYPIGVVGSGADRATAEAFVAFVRGPQGQTALEGAGFLPADGAG